MESDGLGDVLELGGQRADAPHFVAHDIDERPEVLTAFDVAQPPLHERQVEADAVEWVADLVG